MGRTARALGAAAVAAVLATGARAAPPWAPAGWYSRPSQARQLTNPVAVVFDWALRAYRATAGRVDGSRCPSHPTCSAYAREAVARHGPITGWVLTAGRLLSEADEAAFAPRILVGGRWKVYAPVEDDLAFLRGGLDP